MQPDRAAVATVGDLLDLEARMEARMDRMEARMDQRYATKSDLLDLEVRMDKRFHDFEERITRTLAGEIARSTNVMIEHMTSLIRATGDHTKAVEERLNAHLADERVHVSAGRP